MAFSLQKKVFDLQGILPTRLFPSFLCSLPSIRLFSVWISLPLLYSALLLLVSSLLYFFLLDSSLLFSCCILFILLYVQFFSLLYNYFPYSTFLFSALFYLLYSIFLEFTIPYSTLLFFILLFSTFISSPLPLSTTFIHCLRSAYILFSVIQSFCKKHPSTSTEGRGNSIDIIGSFILHCLVIFG